MCPSCGGPIDVPMQQIAPLGYQPPMQQPASQFQSWQGGLPTQSGKKGGGLSNKLVIGITCAGGGILLLLILLVVVQSLVSSNEDGVAEERRESNSENGVSTPSKQDWKTFTSKEGGFSVELPGKLDLSPSANHKEQLGGRLNQVTADFPGGSTTITWSKGIPAEVQSDPDAAFELLVTTLPAKLNGNLISNKKISLESNPGASSP